MMTEQEMHKKYRSLCSITDPEKLQPELMRLLDSNDPVAPFLAVGVLLARPPEGLDRYQTMQAFVWGAMQHLSKMEQQSIALGAVIEFRLTELPVTAEHLPVASETFTPLLQNILHANELENADTILPDRISNKNDLADHLDRATSQFPFQSVLKLACSISITRQAPDEALGYFLQLNENPSKLALALFNFLRANEVKLLILSQIFPSMIPITSSSYLEYKEGQLAKYEICCHLAYLSGNTTEAAKYIQETYRHVFPSHVMLSESSHVITVPLLQLFFSKSQDALIEYLQSEPQTLDSDTIQQIASYVSLLAEHCQSEPHLASALLAYQEISGFICKQLNVEKLYFANPLFPMITSEISEVVAQQNLADISTQDVLALQKEVAASRSTRHPFFEHCRRQYRVMQELETLEADYKKNKASRHRLIIIYSLGLTVIQDINKACQYLPRSTSLLCYLASSGTHLEWQEFCRKTHQSILWRLFRSLDSRSIEGCERQLEQAFEGCSMPSHMENIKFFHDQILFLKIESFFTEFHPKLDGDYKRYINDYSFIIAKLHTDTSPQCVKTHREKSNLSTIRQHHPVFKGPHAYFKYTQPLQACPATILKKRFSEYLQHLLQRRNTAVPNEKQFLLQLRNYIKDKLKPNESLGILLEKSQQLLSPSATNTSHGTLKIKDALNLLFRDEVMELSQEITRIKQSIAQARTLKSSSELEFLNQLYDAYTGFNNDNITSFLNTLYLGLRRYFAVALILSSGMVKRDNYTMYDHACEIFSSSLFLFPFAGQAAPLTKKGIDFFMTSMNAYSLASNIAPEELMRSATQLKTKLFGLTEKQKFIAVSKIFNSAFDERHFCLKLSLLTTWRYQHQLIHHLDADSSKNLAEMCIEKIWGHLIQTGAAYSPTLCQELVLALGIKPKKTRLLSENITDSMILSQTGLCITTESGEQAWYKRDTESSHDTLGFCYQLPGEKGDPMLALDEGFEPTQTSELDSPLDYYNDALCERFAAMRAPQ